MLGKFGGPLRGSTAGSAMPREAATPKMHRKTSAKPKVAPPKKKVKEVTPKRRENKTKPTTRCRYSVVHGEICD